jgi:hypothetical protein
MPHEKDAKHTVVGAGSGATLGAMMGGPPGALAGAIGGASVGYLLDESDEK